MFKKKVLISILIVLIAMMMLFVPKTFGASLTISASNSNPTVGDSITITVGSGVGGKVSLSSSNPSVISVSSSMFIDYNSASFSVKANSAGSCTITVTAVDLVSTDAEPVEITGSKSITINVKEKQVEAPSDGNQSGSGDSSGTNSGNSNKGNSNSGGSNQSASNKPNTNKDAVKDVEETEQEEEATPQFGMNSLMLNAVDEEGNKQEIAFTPTFNIDTYEYTAEIESNIVDVDVLTEAGEYNDYVKVEKPESFNSGENIIKITMQKDDMSLTYTIKVNKKESEETVETVSDAVVESENKKQTLITFTIPQFIAVILTICLIEGLLLKLPWKKMIMACKRRKGFGEDYDDELDNDETENGNENNGKNND